MLDSISCFLLKAQYTSRSRYAAYFFCHHSFLNTMNCCEDEETMERKLFRYADFLFVFVQSVKELRKSNVVKIPKNELHSNLFWVSVITTRTLVAHAIISSSNTEINITISNICALLKLAGIDLGRDKVKYEGFTVECVECIEMCGEAIHPITGHTVQRSLKSIHFDISDPQLKKHTFAKLKQSFDSMSTTPEWDKMYCLYLHIIHKLISERDNTAWRSKTNNFAKYNVWNHDASKIVPLQ